MLRKRFMILGFFILSTCTWAQDASRGQALYKKCISCHGASGEGKKSMKAPKLAGQFDWYLVDQLNSFKSLKRKNTKMYPFIKNLNEQDFKDLAAYLSSLKW